MSKTMILKAATATVLLCASVGQAFADGVSNIQYNQYQYQKNQANVQATTTDLSPLNGATQTGTTYAQPTTTGTGGTTGTTGDTTTPTSNLSASSISPTTPVRQPNLPGAQATIQYSVRQTVQNSIYPNMTTYTAVQTQAPY